MCLARRGWAGNRRRNPLSVKTRSRKPSLHLRSEKATGQPVPRHWPFTSERAGSLCNLSCCICHRRVFVHVRSVSRLDQMPRYGHPRALPFSIDGNSRRMATGSRRIWQKLSHPSEGWKCNVSPLFVDPLVSQGLLSLLSARSGEINDWVPDTTSLTDSSGNVEMPLYVL